MDVNVAGVSLALEHHIGDEPEYVVTTPRGRHYSVPVGVFHALLSAHEEGENNEPKPLDAGVDAILERILALEGHPRQILSKGFWLRVPLASAAVVDRVAGLFTVAFSPKVWPIMLFLALTSIGIMIDVARTTPMKTLGPIPDLVLMYLVTMIAYMFHEIGHASALKASGRHPGPIGFTMYLIFPAFYSDVTEAWRLPRFKRAAVDVAGSYFQITAAIWYLAGFLITHEAFWWYALLLIGTSLVTNANPVFRFDGYWLVRDLFGVTNVLHLPRKMALKYRGDTLRMIPAQLFAGTLCAIWFGYVILMLNEIVGIAKFIALKVHV